MQWDDSLREEVVRVVPWAQYRFARMRCGGIDVSWRTLYASFHAVNEWIVNAYRLRDTGVDALTIPRDLTRFRTARLATASVSDSVHDSVHIGIEVENTYMAPPSTYSAVAMFQNPTDVTMTRIVFPTRVVHYPDGDETHMRLVFYDKNLRRSRPVLLFPTFRQPLNMFERQYPVEFHATVGPIRIVVIPSSLWEHDLAYLRLSDARRGKLAQTDLEMDRLAIRCIRGVTVRIETNSNQDAVDLLRRFVNHRQFFSVVSEYEKRACR